MGDVPWKWTISGNLESELEDGEGEGEGKREEGLYVNAVISPFSTGIFTSPKSTPLTMSLIITVSHLTTRMDGWMDG